MDKKVWKPQKGKLLVKYKAKHNQPLKRYLELTLPTKNRGKKSKRKIEKNTNERKIIHLEFSRNKRIRNMLQTASYYAVSTTQAVVTSTPQITFK